MARLKVRVTKIEAKRGQGGSYAIVHLAGGKRAYVWDRALAEALVTPGIYEVEAEERRGFLRIIAARPVAANNETQGQSQTQGHAQEPPEASTAPGVSQERVVALQAAVALAPHLGLRDIGQVVAIAERLMRWLRRES